MPFRGTLAGVRDGPCKPHQEQDPTTNSGWAMTGLKAALEKDLGVLVDEKLVSVGLQPRKPPISWAASKAKMAAGEGGDFIHRIFILSSEWVRKLSSNNANKLRVIWILSKYLAVTSPTKSQKANPALVTTEQHI